MTLDVVLIARALRSKIDAGYIQLMLDLARAPHDRADAMAIRFWRNILAIVGDGETMLAAGHSGILGYAVALPDYVVDSSGAISELVRAWNAGEGTGWRHPAFLAPTCALVSPPRAERAA